MKDYLENSKTLELTIEDFDSGQLPSLDDLMRELDNDATTANSTAAQKSQPTASPNNRPNSDLIQTQNALSQMENQKNELEAKLKRVSSDFDKFRWRAERERTEHYAFAVTSIVRQFLPILDNFERALASSETTDENQQFVQFVGGVELIYQQTVKFLADIGVQQLQTVGSQFDPRLHEAVETEPRSDCEPNTVVTELLRGYQMGEKLIRPAMVKVSVKDEG